MKKVLRTFFVIFAVLFVASCASNKGSRDVGIEGEKRPDWVKKMGMSNDVTHYEVGYGKMSNYATSLKKVEADARNKIAFWIQTDVNTVLKTYTQDSGMGDNRELIEFMEEVSKQTANFSLSGAQIEDAWEDADGGVYVLMSFPVDKAGATLDNQLKTYQRSESAAFAEFKAQEAFKQMQYEQSQGF